MKYINTKYIVAIGSVTSMFQIKKAHYTQFVRDVRKCEWTYLVQWNGLSLHHVIREHIINLHPTKDKSILSKIILNFGKY